MDIRSALKFLSINLKRNFVPHLIAALLIALLTPIIFAVSSLDERLAAQPIEMMLSLTGTALLTPIFLPEQNENIRDVIRSKRIDYMNVCIMRIIYSVIALFLIIGGFVLMMGFCESQITFRHLIGGFASALFLGSLGFLVAGFSRNAPVGYMVSLIYYIANFAMKDKLGNLFLFSMCSGSFIEKYWLLTASVIMLIAGVFSCKIQNLFS